MPGPNGKVLGLWINLDDTAKQGYFYAKILQQQQQQQQQRPFNGL